MLILRSALAIGAVLMLGSRAGASELLLEQLVVGTKGILGWPPRAVEAIEIPIGIEFHLVHFSGTSVPLPQLPDAVLFDGLVLTEASAGQVFRRGPGDAEFDAFAALLSDGAPGFVGEFSRVFFAGGADAGSGASESGECAYLYPGRSDCEGAVGHSPDLMGVAILDGVEFEIESVGLSYREETRYTCIGESCGFFTFNGYRADYRGVTRWYGSAIPEPATALCLGAGLACIGIARRSHLRGIGSPGRA